VTEYAGGYDDWLRQCPAVQSPEKKDSVKIKPKSKPRPSRKLGYMQQREIQELPKKIEALEAEHETLFKVMSAPLFYKKDKSEIAGVKSHLQHVEKEIEKAYGRWEELEALNDKGNN